MERCQLAWPPPADGNGASSGGQIAGTAVLPLVRAVAALGDRWLRALSMPSGDAAREAFLSAVTWHKRRSAERVGRSLVNILRRTVLEIQNALARNDMQPGHLADGLHAISTLLQLQPLLADLGLGKDGQSFVPSADGNVTAGEALLYTVVELVYSVHRQGTLEELPPDPPLPDENADDQSSGRGGPARGASDAAPRKPPPESPPLEVLHHLYILARHVMLHTTMSRLGPLQSGQAPVELFSRLPYFMVEAIRSITSTLTRLLALPLQRFSLCCNPESGKPSSHIFDFMEEILKPDGVLIRRQLLLDDLVVAGVARLSPQLRLGGGLSDEALECVWTWLRDVVDLRSDVLGRQEQEAGVTSALHGMLSLLKGRHVERVQAPALGPAQLSTGAAGAGGIAEESGAAEDSRPGGVAGGQVLSYSNLEGLPSARIAGPPVSFLHAPAGQRLWHVASLLETETSLRWELERKRTCLTEERSAPDVSGAKGGKGGAPVAGGKKRRWAAGRVWNAGLVGALWPPLSTARASTHPAVVFATSTPFASCGCCSSEAQCTRTGPSSSA